jgi:hypothetical protein
VDVTIVGTDARVTLGVTDGWLQKHRLVTVAGPIDQPTPIPGSTGVFLLRKLAESYDEAGLRGLAHHSTISGPAVR